jgi:predicted HTH domain antitoxin
MARRSLLDEELAAVTEAGFYKSREAFLTDAVNTFLASRPDLRETVACHLYEKGVFSLGRAAEWSGLSVEEIKQSLFQKGVVRQSSSDLAEIEEQARRSAEAAGRTAR